MGFANINIVTFYYLLISHYGMVKSQITFACHENYNKSGSSLFPRVKIVDVLLNTSLHLKCNFCFAKNDYNAKIWYYKRRGTAIPFEETPRNRDFNLYKIFVTPYHTLIIHDFNLSNSGIYICKPTHNRISNIVFTYVLDGVFNINIKPIIGKWCNFQEFKRKLIDPINRKLIRQQEQLFFNAGRMVPFSLKLVIFWETWGPCEMSNHHKAIRKKHGKCYLHPLPRNDSSQITSDDPFIQDLITFYLIDNYDISCRSIQLNETLSKISEIVKHIPDFLLMEDCNVTRLTKYTERKRKFKYTSVVKITENGHATLICPEITVDSKVEWYKNNSLMNSSYRNNMIENAQEPHLTVDSYHSLYILHPTKNEEAVYSCVVDGKKVQEFNVKIISKTNTLNDEFIRYSIYLGFVLSLTITCYCTGICVAWHRRTSFIDPMYLRNNRHA